MGVDMLRGGGKLVIAANGRNVGAGHFGLIDLGDDVQKFSFHYEADLDRGGRSVLAIRSLLWQDGWPIAGEDFKGGTFAIESVRSGFTLELGVEAVPLSTTRPRRGETGPIAPIPDQDVAVVSQNWPSGDIEIRIADYMLQAHQKWTITPSPMWGAIWDHPFSRSLSPGRSARWPQPRISMLSRFPPLPVPRAIMANRPVDRRDVQHHAQEPGRSRLCPDRGGPQYAVTDQVQRQEPLNSLEIYSAVKTIRRQNAPIEPVRSGSLTARAKMNFAVVVAAARSGLRTNNTIAL
jgi:hypothetical protein